MTAYINLAEYCHTFFAISVIALILIGAYIIAAAVTMRLSPVYVTCSVVLTAAVFIVLQSMADVSLCANEADPRFSFPAVILKDVPWIMVALVIVVIFAAEVLCLVAVNRAGRDKLSPGSVKESLDALPDGVCFFSEDGRILLSNRRMQHISSDITGIGILNGEKLWRCIEEKSVKTDVSDGLVIFTSDSKVWNVRRSEIEAEGNRINEIVALDVTEQYELRRELEERNERLNSVNERLRIFSRDMSRLTAEKELLDAKIKVHDDLGRSLLAFRAYLTAEPPKRDRSKLLPLWRYVISVMKKETVPSEEWDAIEKTAESLHIQIEINGDLPAGLADLPVNQFGDLPAGLADLPAGLADLPVSGEVRSAIMAAIRECLTNTARHARGDRLFVLIKCGAEQGADHASTSGSSSASGTAPCDDAPHGIRIEITNNGRAPLVPIQEAGGLSNLRHMVEREGGIMTIESSPQFLLRLDFKS